MRLKNLDLMLSTALVFMNVVWVWLPISHPSAIGVVLALPLVFLLPGYTLTEALFYKRPFGALYRFIFSLGIKPGN